MLLTRLLLFLTSILGPFLVDQYTKGIALDELTALSVRVFSWCEFVLTFNHGVSWSLLAAHTAAQFYMLIGLISGVLLFFGFYTLKRALTGRTVYFELMLISAALSNMYDRITIGAVIDFIHLHYGAWSMPVFNLADVFISVCAGLIFLRSFTEE